MSTQEIRERWENFVRVVGKMWWDFGEGPDGEMWVGIECDKPPEHKHYLAWLPSPPDATKIQEIATVLVSAPTDIATLLQGIEELELSHRNMEGKVTYTDGELSDCVERLTSAEAERDLFKAALEEIAKGRQVWRSDRPAEEIAGEAIEEPSP